MTVERFLRKGRHTDRQRDQQTEGKLSPKCANTAFLLQMCVNTAFLSRKFDSFQGYAVVIDSSANYAGLMHRASYLVVENKGFILKSEVYF